MASVLLVPSLRGGSPGLLSSKDHDKLDSYQLIVGDNKVLVRHFSLEAGLPSTLSTRAVCVHGKSGGLLKKKTLGPHMVGFPKFSFSTPVSASIPMRKNGGKKAYSALLCSVGFDDVITLAMNTVALAMNTVALAT